MRDGGFEQAAIRIENEKEFEELKDAVNRAFGSQRVEGWLTRVRTMSKVEEVEPGLRFQQLYRDY